MFQFQVSSLASPVFGIAMRMYKTLHSTCSVLMVLCSFVFTVTVRCMLSVHVVPVTIVAQLILLTQACKKFRVLNLAEDRNARQ